MSNQTFVKKDRISFAQNLNEKLVIAPSNLTTNALFLVLTLRSRMMVTLTYKLSIR